MRMTSRCFCGAALLASVLAGCARPEASGSFSFLWLDGDGEVVHSVDREVTDYRNGLCEHDHYGGWIVVIAETDSKSRDELEFSVVDGEITKAATARWRHKGGYAKLFPRPVKNASARDQIGIEDPVEGTVSGSVARIDRVWYVSAEGAYPAQTPGGIWGSVTIGDDGRKIPAYLVETVEWRLRAQVPSVLPGYFGFWDWC